MKPLDPTDFSPTDKIMEFPSEIIGLKTMGDRLIVDCIDGVSHIVSKERFVDGVLMQQPDVPNDGGSDE